MQYKSGFGEGPTYVISLWLIDCLFDLIAMHDWFILLYDMLKIIP